MKRTIITLALITVLSLALFAQEGVYVRKSVSSLESVWINHAGVDLRGEPGEELQLDRFMDFIKFYVEVDRFDYNKLPDEFIDEFLNKANQLTDININTLADVVNETIVPRVLDILNDPDIQKERAEGLMSEAERRSFLRSKAQEVGLTFEQLEVLFNSAYIYLPFITSANSEISRGNNVFRIEGGIIWWNIVDDDVGKAEVREVVSATTRGSSAVNPQRPSSRRFRFGHQVWETTPAQHAQYDAMLAFAKNLGVKTKQIDDFKLTAPIVEVPQPKRYGIEMGFLEGIHLDDGFHIVEYEEQDGEVVAVRKGFVRVAKTGRNHEDPTEKTYTRQLIGRPVSEGAILMEHPRLGIDLRVGAGMTLMSNIEPLHTQIPGYANEGVISEETDSQISFNLLFSYNLAPIIGWSQTFISLDAGFALPNASYRSDADAFVFVASPYLSFTKKFGGRAYFAPTIGGGVDALSMMGEFGGTDFTLSIYSPGVKASGEIGYLLSPDWTFFLSAGYKVGLEPFSGNLDWGGSDIPFIITGDQYKDLNLGGLSISAGLSYSLAELPWNVFGFLDPLKRH